MQQKKEYYHFRDIKYVDSKKYQPTIKGKTMFAKENMSDFLQAFGVQTAKPAASQPH